MRTSNTIKQAKDWLRSKMDKGATCPCCNQFVKMYKRKLNSTMARSLVRLYHLDKFNSIYYHNVNIVKSVSESVGDFAKLLYWGMIEQKPNDDDKSKKNAGMWKITDKGRMFVEGKIKVPKHVNVYNSKPYGFTMEETDIKEALGDKFDYSELMKEKQEKPV